MNSAINIPNATNNATIEIKEKEKRQWGREGKLIDDKSVKST